MNNIIVDRFKEFQVLRYKTPGFENLSLQKKKLIYYLSKAAICGRDIIYDQNGKYNLIIRRALEYVYVNYPDKTEESFKQLETYLKLVWFSNGIHHSISEYKFIPEFTEWWFRNALDITKYYDKVEDRTLLEETINVLFNNDCLKMRSVKNKAEGDLLELSSCNLYQGVTEREAVNYYTEKSERDERYKKLSIGLNSELIKHPNGTLIEVHYKVGQIYSDAIKEIVYWLKKALTVVENDEQFEVISKLIDFYYTGSLETFNDYNISWIKDVNSKVDFVNGFIETYLDPLGFRGSWEGLVNFKNEEATKRTEIISRNAQWFEDNSPTDKEFKKESVTGVVAKVITVAMLGGDSYPHSPTGINLPNANWIRKEFGSKSVTLDNVIDATFEASGDSGFIDEFVIPDMIDLCKKYRKISYKLLVDLHECAGHGSGKLMPGITKDSLKEHASAIEEARADLFALYYLPDKKLIELGLLPDEEAYKAEYYASLACGLYTQLSRIKLGNNIEEAHLRDRQLISYWVLDHAKNKEIELVEIEGKHYLKINDFLATRTLIGELLKEIQRITSTGDYNAAKELIEKYAISVNQDLHKEVLERDAKLNRAKFSGFVNPRYYEVRDENTNEVIDIKQSFEEDFISQNLRYSKDYSFLD